MARLWHLILACMLCAAFSATAAPWADDVASLQGAAEGGDLQALTLLAVKHEHAEGVPLDHDRAHALYCRAAKLGHADAQYRLGWIYANGRGGRRDEALAAALFRMAADRGHEYATRALAHVPERPDVELPPCLLPDPPAPVAATPVPAAGYADEASQDAELFAAVPVRKEIAALVRRLAPQYGVDTHLVLAVIFAESNFDAAAVSPKNAQGLMQLIPETAQRFGVKKPFDPTENLKGGMAYLQWLLAFFQGDVPLVLAAYNAGERAVEKHRGIPPYPETRNYVRKITTIYRKKTHPYDSGLVQPSPLVGGARAPQVVRP